MKMNKYVGLDVHSVDTVIAVADGGRTGEVRLYGKVSSNLHAVDEARQRAEGEARSGAQGETNGCPWHGR